MQRINAEKAGRPRGEIEVAGLRYQEYTRLKRRRQVEPLINRVVEDASEEEISCLMSFLEWQVQQLDDRGHEADEKACDLTPVGASIGE